MLIVVFKIPVLSSRYFLSYFILPCVSKQCLDTHICFDSLCLSSLIVVTNSLRCCVNAVDALSALSPPCVFHLWATTRGRSSLPSIDMVIHRCLSSLSIVYGVLVQLRLSSLSVVIARCILVVRAQSSHPTLPSRYGVAVIIISFSSSIIHANQLYLHDQCHKLPPSSPPLNADPFSTVANPCLPHPSLHIPSQPYQSITIALSPDGGGSAPARQLPLTPPPLRTPIRSHPSPSNTFRAVALLPLYTNPKRKCYCVFFLPSNGLFKRLEP